MKKILILSVVFLSGCISNPPVSNPQPEFSQWETHKQQLTELSNWQMNSRIFIEAQNDGFSSSIQWEQRDPNYQLQFSAPFSQGQYVLTGKPDEVSILLPDNTRQHAKDPESLMKQTIGFELPVSGLSYWLRGLPYPEDPQRDIVLDTNERLSKLKQSGWKITVSKYIHKDGYYLPTKLKMENRYVKIKMAVKHWNTRQQAN